MHSFEEIRAHIAAKHPLRINDPYLICFDVALEQVRGQIAAERDGRHLEGPGRQRRGLLRTGALGQQPVKAWGQAAAQQPVPGAQPPDGQAAEVVFEHDVHRAPLCGLRDP